MAQKAPKPIPDGMNRVTTHLYYNGNCSEALDFYQKTFDAKPYGPAMPYPDGKGIMHAMITIGDTNLMMADVWPDSYEQGPKEKTTASLWVYVDNCDIQFKKAIDAGCKVSMPLNDSFWGDRFGSLKDPFGHSWSFATFQWIYTPEEMAQKQEEMMKSGQ